jgi:hypothetical protein
MAISNTSSGLKPAQVMLSDADRELQRALKRRLLDLGIDSAGPTTLFRAGLRALVQGDDKALVRAIDQAEERIDPAELEERFGAWCRAIDESVVSAEPALLGTYDGSHRGSYSYQGRFVALSLMHDGRILIGGLAAVTSPIQSGHPIAHASQLFPGGLATMVSMNGEGEELAKRAIIVWLLGRDDELNAIRAAFRAHTAQAIR